tara:strand:+ start:141 stop:506 length:366 start_codon:yes stop_codon:yes gene_type:complete
MISKTITTFFCIFMLSSCATYSVVSSNTLEDTMILVQGDYKDLVGLTIKTEDFVINSVERSDTYKEKQQSSNQINNNWRSMVSIKVPVSPGTTNLKIYKNGKVIYEKDLYVGSGQVRKIQI